MPRTLMLASLHSHMAVEIGDTVPIFGDPDARGQVAALDVDKVSVKCPAAHLHGPPSGFDIVLMDQRLTRTRPAEPVDHWLHRLAELPAAA